jgi:hypothetical protein
MHPPVWWCGAVEELSRREAAQTAILYTFDLIEHNGENLRDRPFLERKAAPAQLLCGLKAGILLNEHIAENGATVFAHACQLGAERIDVEEVDSTYRSGPCRVWIKGPQSRQHRRAAGTRDLASTSFTQCAPTVTRRNSKRGLAESRCG